MPTHKCEFCDAVLSTKYALAAHNRTAKYCLKLRDEKVPSVKCEHCDKQFTYKTALTRHNKICPKLAKLKRETELTELKEQVIAKEEYIRELEAKSKTASLQHQNRICELEAKLRKTNKRVRELEHDGAYDKGRIVELKSTKPQSVTNYIHPKLINIPIENIRPLTVATVREDVHKYTYDTFLRGLPGLKEFVEDIIITEVEGDTRSDRPRNYVCTDVSRNKFHRLLESKEWTADGGARFINTILDELQDVATEHFRALVEEEKAAVTDEFKRQQITLTQGVVKPIFFGITSSGESRDELFKSLRNEIKSTASV